MNAVYILARIESDELLTNLKISGAGTVDEIPNSNWCGRLPNGWTVISIEDQSFLKRAKTQIHALTKSNSIIIGEFYESVMHFKTTFYAKGSALWSLESGDENSRECLKIMGVEALPNELKAQMPDSEADENGMEFPAQAMRILTGFGYDEVWEAHEFQVLQEVIVPPPSMTKDGVGASVNHFIVNHTLWFLAISMILLLLFSVVGIVILVSLVGPAIHWLLGDWGDICLFNCSAAIPND